MHLPKLHASRVVAALGVALAVPGFAAAGQGKATADAKGAQHVTEVPETIQWSPGPPSLPEGAQVAVLEGDPKQKGVFTMRLKAPAGYVIPPHTHPKYERVTVLSGRFQLGMGADFNEAKLKDLPAGSFFLMTPGMQHFARAAEETVVQLTGEGPWEINYVRPADDPRKRRQAAAK